MLFEVKVGNNTQVVAASSTGAAKQAVYQQRLINSWISQGFNREMNLDTVFFYNTRIHIFQFYHLIKSTKVL